MKKSSQRLLDRPRIAWDVIVCWLVLIFVCGLTFRATIDLLNFFWSR